MEKVSAVANSIVECHDVRRILAIGSCTGARRVLWLAEKKTSQRRSTPPSAVSKIITKPSPPETSDFGPFPKCGPIGGFLAWSAKTLPQVIGESAHSTLKTPPLGQSDTPQPERSGRPMLISTGPGWADPMAERSAPTRLSPTGRQPARNLLQDLTLEIGQRLTDMGAGQINY